jgi:hypothetical protein
MHALHLHGIMARAPAPQLKFFVSILLYNIEQIYERTGNRNRILFRALLTVRIGGDPVSHPDVIVIIFLSRPRGAAT